jgi:hypothetical protein
MNITKRCVHPQEQTIRDAMEKAREVKAGHNSGHSANSTASEQSAGSAVTN